MGSSPTVRTGKFQLSDINSEEDVMNEFELMEHTLRFWVNRDLGHFNDVDKLFRSYKVRITGPQDPVERGVLHLWTSKNRYSIIFGPSRDPDDGKGYLGCGASSRKWRTGEDWHRGRDLPDGKFNETTWSKILIDIASYELETPVEYRNPVVAPPMGSLSHDPKPCSEIPLSEEFLSDMKAIEYNIPTSSSTKSSAPTRSRPL